MKNTRNSIVLGAALCGFAPFAFATLLTPGNTVTASNNIQVTNDGTVGSISGTLTANTFTGTYTESVIKDGSNPFGANDLTFIFAVSNNATSPNGIEHVSDGDGSNSFALSPTINVGYLAGAGDDGTDVPLTIDETTYGTVEFDFTNGDAIASGTGTEFLVIQTSVTNFVPGDFSVIDSSSDTVPGFVPAATTPEPGSFALLGTGLLAGCGALWTKRRQRMAASL